MFYVLIRSLSFVSFTYNQKYKIDYYTAVLKELFQMKHSGISQCRIYWSCPLVLVLKNKLYVPSI